MKRLIIYLIFLVLSSTSSAEIIQVPGSYGDTPTAYWPSPNSKAILIFFPGGDGSFDIASKNPPKPLWVLSKLYDVSQKNPGLDLVFVDSPYSLGMRGGNIAPRYTKDHLSRALTVVQFYKDKTKNRFILLVIATALLVLQNFLINHKIINNS